MTQTLTNPKRIISYDIIRIVAIVLVILTHASADFILSSPADSTNFIIANILDSISRISVPLFVMLSGALLLNENKTFDLQVMKKYVIRIFVLLYVWSFIYALIYQIILPILREQTISMTSFVKAIIFGHYHQWYLFMIIGIYLVTPILKLFTKKENKKYILWFIFLTFISKSVILIPNFLINHVTNTTDILLDYSSSFSLNFVNNYMTYYFLGWYFCNFELSEKFKKALYFLGILGLLITIIGVQIFTPEYPKVYNVFYSNLSMNTLFYSTAVFVFITSRKWDKLNSKFTISLSKMAFGVYLIHPIMLTVLRYLPITKAAIFNIPFNWIMCTILSFICVYVMSRIPYIKLLTKN